jgi:predicted ATPase/class 3 adenylate cyclase
MSDYRALLLTDVVDSTKLSEQLGNAAMAEIWAAHDRVARDLLREAGGREIDKTDGMLLMFDYAADAVDYALAYHQALAALPVPLKARAGLHVGPVILRENSAEDIARGAKPLEVEGLAKPTAARVMAVARGGQLLMTAEAREALGKTWLRVVCHGHWLMKGLAEPVELFEAGEYESRFVPPTDGDKGQRVVRTGDRWLSVDELPNNLPQQTTTFIGRERELGEVKGLMGSARLLTLVGMGGLGKTRLSLQVAAELRHHFPDGCWFVDLAPLRDPALVVGEVAQTLGVREEPDRPLLQAVCAFLKPRRVLLILDNCEHLLQATAQLANALLRVAPEVRILASSREALHVPGEQAYPVLPLPVPAQGGDLGLLAQSTAVRLFIDRARLQKPSFDLTEREAPAVAELVTRLEGIPLALELAAARVRSMSVADINARLKDRYKLLTGGGKVLLERQQTLRALVDWSYDLLNEREQVVLRRLAVFAGGCDLAAAEAVCGAEPLAADDVLDLLGSLVEKSIVMLEEGDAGARYRMLETIRDYAREKLEQAGDTEATARRHCEHYFAVAKGIRDGLQGAEQALWVSCGEQELDNLRAAMALPLAGGIDPALAVKFAGALYEFWNRRGYVTEGRDVVRAALALPGVKASPRAHAFGLQIGAGLAFGQSDHREARRMHEDCLELLRELDEPHWLAATLSTLSIARLQGGDPVGAVESEQEALQLCLTLGETRGQAVSLLHLGQIAAYRGDFAAAERALEEGLEAARSTKFHEIEAECELVLGELACERGECELARARFGRSLAVATDAGDRRGAASATWWLGKLDLEAADLAAARRGLAEAMQAFRAFQMREELIGCLEDTAALLLAERSPLQAARLSGLVERLREQLALPHWPRQLQQWQDRLAAIRAEIEPETYEAARGEGRAADLDALVQDVFAPVA